MGVTDLVMSYVTKFRTPRFMNVQDLRLGTTNLGLQIAICVYFVIVMVTLKEYETKVTPDGTAQYFMSSENMYKEQGTPATAAYCAAAVAGAYDYQDPDCLNGDSFWCEDNIKCSYPTFGEASKKFDSSLWVYTYLKDGHYYKDTCANLPDQSACDTRTGTTNEFVWSYQVPESTIGGCQCFKTTNTLFTGTEGARVQIASSYYLASLDKKEINVLTRVRKAGFAHIHGEHESDEMVFTNTGQNINILVKDLLRIAGITDLNAPNTEAMGQYPSKIPGEITPYRQTGYEIQLDFSWVGSVGGTIPNGSNVELILSVIGKAGYSSKGNDVDYVEYPESNDPTVYAQKSQYHDRYYRGIKIGFTYGGTIGYFDMYNLVVVFTSFTILLSLSGTIVSLIAYFFLGYESEVYNSYGNSDVSIKRLHGKVAAQALVASAVWKKVIGLHTMDSPSFEELVEKYMENGYGREDAMYLSKALLETSQPDEDKGLASLNDKIAQFNKITATASHMSGFDAVVSLAGGSSKKNTTDDEEAAEIVDDEFASIRNESMNMTEFCDLISEEQTSLSKCMNALGGGELEMDGDADNFAEKDEENGGNVELITPSAAGSRKPRFGIGETIEILHAVYYKSGSKQEWVSGVVTGYCGAENYQIKKSIGSNKSSVVHKSKCRRVAV